MAKTTKLEDIINKLNDKIDSQNSQIDSRLDNIEKVMIAQEINLKAHMQRSNHLETIVEALKESDLKPIQKHISMVEGVFKFIGLISLLIGIISSFIKLFGLI